MRESVFCFMICAGVLFLSGCQQGDLANGETGGNANNTSETDMVRSYVGKVDVAEPVGDEKITMGAKLFVNHDDVTDGTIAVRIRLQEGWHLYASLGPDAFETKAKLTLNETKGITENGDWILPPTTPDSNDALKMYWEGDLVFAQKVKLDEVSDGPTVKFAYQACNESSCLPPTKTDIPVEK